MRRLPFDAQGASSAPKALPTQQGSLAPIRFASSPRRPNGSPQPRRTAARPLNVFQLDRPAAPAAPARPAILPTAPQPLLAHEFIKGALVRYSSGASVEHRPPPTAVLVHGILGSRRNMQSFARRLVEGFPSWQVLLVDLRCHGESAPLSAELAGAHGVEPAAADCLRLLSALKLFPEVLIGHSFGGKVVLSMAHQFGAAAGRLPRPVKVWALDSLPGEIRSGEMGAGDRPVDLITALMRTPLPLATKGALTARLEAAGFSQPVAAWAASSLVPVDTANRAAGFVWGFDLPGIAQMYASYESTDLWPLLAAPAEGIRLGFVKAERSTFRWGGGDEARIRGLGHEVAELPNSGHWVHTDNPDGLFDILAPSFGGAPDIHMRRSPSASPRTSLLN